jgi:hypothetical protein
MEKSENELDIIMGRNSPLSYVIAGSLTSTLGMGLLFETEKRCTNEMVLQTNWPILAYFILP